MPSVRNCPPGKEFVFRTPDGKEVGKAKNIVEFAQLLKTVPLSSVLYHANGKHFTPWLQMMGEYRKAAKIESARGEGESLRRELINACL